MERLFKSEEINDIISDFIYLKRDFVNRYLNFNMYNTLDTDERVLIEKEQEQPVLLTKSDGEQIKQNSYDITSVLGFNQAFPRTTNNNMTRILSGPHDNPSGAFRDELFRINNGDKIKSTFKASAEDYTYTEIGKGVLILTTDGDDNDVINGKKTKKSSGHKYRLKVV